MGTFQDGLLEDRYLSEKSSEFGVKNQSLRLSSSTQKVDSPLSLSEFVNFFELRKLQLNENDKIIMFV